MEFFVRSILTGKLFKFVSKEVPRPSTDNLSLLLITNLEVSFGLFSPEFWLRHFQRETKLYILGVNLIFKENIFNIMAAKRDIDNMADMLSCQVCFEDFEETGPRIPRIFPCSHTVCESCLKDLITNDTIVCPECRKKHRAEKKEKSFPQNKYLLAQIGGNNNATEDQGNDKRCEKHGERLVLYCLEDTCQKSICVSCIMDHNKHDVVRDKDREKEVVRRKVAEIMKNIQAKVEIISKASKDITDKADLCVKEMENTKQEVNQYLDNMIEEVENQKCRGAIIKCEAVGIFSIALAGVVY